MQRVIRQRNHHEQLLRIVSLGMLLWVVIGGGDARGGSDAPFAADSWTPKITWRLPSQMYATGVHATLMPDGRVLLIGAQRANIDGRLNPGQFEATNRAAFILTPTPLGQVAPTEQVVAEIAQPVEMDNVVMGATGMNDDLFCTGNALTSDGRFFSAGGTRLVVDFNARRATVFGLPYATVFDAATDIWSRLPQEMVATANLPTPGRWYPAVTRLPDTRMLVTSGYDRVRPAGSINLTVEAFDLVTSTWTEISSFSETPVETFNIDYTHVVVLPTLIGNADILMFGEAGVPLLMTSSGPPNWVIQDASRPGTQLGQAPNRGASTALLPVRLIDGEWGYANGSVLIAGGDFNTVHQRSMDIYDPVANAWGPRILTSVPRHHPTVVLLPNGMVLVAAGHDMNAHSNLRRALYIDPAQGFTATLGNAVSNEIRGYHHIALLMPDGRVLVGGGQDAITGIQQEKSSFRYLHPPYLSQPRPVITDAPDTLVFGQDFSLTSTGPAPAEAVLMAPGSMTHSFDFNQRYVQLRVVETVPSGGAHLSTIMAPPTAQMAPPGVYMLFVLDAARVPSEAVFVSLN